MPSARVSRFAVAVAEPEVERPAFIASNLQIPIFEWFEFPDRNSSDNLIVEARAGTGKTTTILRAVDRAPEEHILLSAFNKRIQEEMASRLDNPRAEALTLHSLGYRMLRRAKGYIRVCDGSNRFAREDALADRVVGGLPYGAKRLVAKLVTKAREIQPLGATVESLTDLALDFDLVPPVGDTLTIAQVARATLNAMEVACEEWPRATGIDHADQIFLPLALDLMQPDYDMVVVDEYQDMLQAQLTLARRACKPNGRIVLVGDSRQAIYGFRGVSATSIAKIKQELAADELPLSRTYRCPRNVVALAQRYVPDYEVDPSAPAGIVDDVEGLDDLVTRAKAGDFVLSRKNAPLARVALRLLRAGKSAKIQGRDIGAGLRALVRTLATGAAAASIERLLEKLGTYEAKMTDRLRAMKAEDRVEVLKDKCETLRWLAEDASGVPALVAKLECKGCYRGEHVSTCQNLFTDDPGASVVCSTVHKAKGLESNHVFLLKSTFGLPIPCECGHRHSKAGCTKCDCEGYVPDQQQLLEEQNIKYVAITRAKQHLTWVNGAF